MNGIALWDGKTIESITRYSLYGQGVVAIQKGTNPPTAEYFETEAGAVEFVLYESVKLLDKGLTVCL